MVKDFPSGEQKRPPVFHSERFPTNAGSRFTELRGEAG